MQFRKAPIVYWALLFACAWLVCAATGAPLARGEIFTSFYITNDAQIDSSNPAYNFGGKGSAKVVVDTKYTPNSLARTVLNLPSSNWTLPEGQALVSAKLYYMINTSNLTYNRTVSLFPLTQSFIQGSGMGSAQTGGPDGATWNTYDGAHAWAAAGGDYDAGTRVDALEEGDRFSWDITSLWNNTNLRTCGALLRMSSEWFDLSDLGSSEMQPRIPFYSAETTVNGMKPYVEIVTVAVPEPAAIVLLASGFLCLPALLLRRKR